MDLYIYYKVKDADAVSLQAAVAAMQSTLAQRHGVAGKLKRRPETKDGVQTWMEVYESTPDGFAALLDSAVHEAGVLAWIAGLRHTEVFLDVIPPCA
jgi:tartrate dehydratase beta subunit/fumarate hydratase class I family protein